MTEFIKLKTTQETIQIGFTDQKVSGRAGLLTFAGFLHWHRFSELLSKVLPHDKTRGIPAADLGLAFLTGILAGAQKLAQVAYLRNDVMLLALLAIQRIGSQSTFTRFFQGFKTAGKNLSTFRCLWRSSRCGVRSYVVAACRVVLSPYPTRVYVNKNIFRKI